MKFKLAGMLTAAAIGLSVFSPSAHAITNLALGAATGASSQTFGAASNAVDGNLVTTYSPGPIFQTGFDAIPSWNVDLGANYSLSQVSIYQRTDEAPTVLHDFAVTVFDTLGNVTFHGDYATSPGDTVSTPYDIIFAGPVLGRSVQILLNHPGYLALAEVQVLGNALNQEDVPEPATMGLLLVGLAGAAAARRKARASV